MRFGTFLALLSSVFLSSCSLGINATNSRTAAPVVGNSAVVSVNSVTLGVTPVINQSLRSVSIDGLPSGRIFSFSLLEDGAPVTDFDCTNLPDTARIIDNRLHVDFGLADLAGTFELSCLTSNGALTIDLSYESSSMSVVSSSFAESPRSTIAAYVPVQTPDGLFSVWVETGRTLSSVIQVVIKNHTTGEVSVVSKTASGELGNLASSNPQVSSDGRYVAFESSATNLVNGASGNQIYRKDLQTGALDLVSSTDGLGVNQGDSSSDSTSMSADGRYVVFTSTSSNLVVGCFGTQIYRKDIQTGAIDLVSSTDGLAANQGDIDSFSPRVSADGRYVAFVSSSTNLVPGNSGEQIFRKDLQIGTIDLVSSTDGLVANEGNSPGSFPQISADGRYVVFLTSANNLVSGTSGSQVFRKDLLLGAIVLVSSTDGLAANQGDVDSSTPHVSADGRYVVFVSGASNLVAGSSGQQAFRKDLQSGAIDLVSSTDGLPANEGDATSYSPQISSEGRYVVFYSDSTNLVAGSGGYQVYRKDLQAGVIDLVSEADGMAASQANSSMLSMQLTPDGRYVVFSTFATNLLSGSASGQIYRKDLQTGDLNIVSSSDGLVANQGNSTSSSPQITSDGRYVVFTSSASNLVAGTTATQVFRKDLQTGAIDLVSSTDGTVGNRGSSSSFSPQITSDGRYVVFTSVSSNLVSGTTGTQVFRKDLQTGSIDLVSSTDGSAVHRGNASSSSPQVSSDGRYVVFYTISNNLVPGSSGYQVFRKDLQIGTIDLVSSTDGSSANQGNSASTTPQITPDGRYVVFGSGATNLVSGTSGSQVFRKDLQTGSIDLVSSSDGLPTTQGDASSSAAQITADGRYVVFFSSATNFVAGGGSQQIYRKDLQTGAIDLVSSTDGTAVNQGNSSNTSPQVSADGGYVAFASNSTNFMAGVSGSQIYLKRMP